MCTTKHVNCSAYMYVYKYTYICIFIYIHMYTVCPKRISHVRVAKGHFCYLSLYLMTASTIFFIFFVREGGLGESFSAGGRPLFLCLFPSSSLSPLPRPAEKEEGPGRSRSRSRLLLRVVFLVRTSSSTSSSVPSSIACRRKTDRFK